MSNFPYKLFSKFILRTTLFSLSDLITFLNEAEFNDELFKKKFQDSAIQEAIYLASPSLYSMLKKWIDGELYDQKKIEKLKHSLLKYFNRMSSRCTPFGLFAGYSIGDFSDSTHILLDEVNTYKRFTRLDMQYLVSLTQVLIQNHDIRKELRFYTNSTVYVFNNEYRYIEYKYYGLKRAHSISAIEKSELVENIVNISMFGCSISDIIKIIISYHPEVKEEEALAYVEQLIECQLIVSELEPSVVGVDYLTNIRKILNKLSGIENINNILNNIELLLNKIDSTFDNKISSYNDIIKHIKNLESEFDLKYLFQTDVKITTKKNTIDRSIIKNIKEGIRILNYLSPIQENNHLSNFKKKFKERYGEQEIPLANALDNETGIIYKETELYNILPDDSFINDLLLSKTRYTNDIKLSIQDLYIHQQISEAYRNNEYIINLDSETLPKQNNSWNDLPETISFISEVVVMNGSTKVILNGAGGSTGANLFGRFSISDPDINDHIKDIIEVDKKYNKDVILAEIVHLPEARVGNVTVRTSQYNYEIPYIANSLKDSDHQININDLMISVNNSGKIKLRSVSKNKEVIPRLINAHNYSNNSTPIYHFLCDLQLQNKRRGILIDFNTIAKLYKFIPRIEYKNIILKKATWNFTKNDLKSLLNITDFDVINEAIVNFRNKWQIPRYINLVEVDNELFIDLENTMTIKMMLDIISNKVGVIFEEFIFQDVEKMIVHKDDKYYTNQIIFSIYKTD